MFQAYVSSILGVFPPWQNTLIESTMDPKDWKRRSVDVFLVPGMKDKETAQNELLKIYDSTMEKYLCTYLPTYLRRKIRAVENSVLNTSVVWST